MAQHHAVSGHRAFAFICLGQLVSAIGTGLTNFALGVWVYQQTGSATKFALVALFSTVPGGLILMLAGVLIDRWNRRWTMILSNTGAGLTTLAATVLLFSGRLEVWHIYLGVSVRSAFIALLEPALAASTTLLVRKQHLGRASGMVQSTRASAQVVSPLLAGILMGTIQLQGVLLLDFASYLFALSTLLLVHIPMPESASAGKTGGKKGSLMREATYGWTYIKERPGLLALLIYFAAVNLVVSVAYILFTPMILSFADAKALGIILSTAGAGFLGGSVLMMFWGGPKVRVHGILGFGFMFGLCCVLIGLKASVPLIAVAALTMFFVLPVINGCSQAIWQCKTPMEVQGRVFAMRRLVATSTIPIALLIAGPLADKIFEPLIAGPLSANIGQIIGNTPGRGIGLMFVVAGILTLLIQLGGYLYPHLRQVEDELPDAIPDMVLTRT
ncbi:MAG TPA: MFS transporter [Pyrinomonadaceae bacterium]|jgi:MFS family permease